MRFRVLVLVVGFAVACGTHPDSGVLAGPTPTPAVLAACANGARPQSELDYAGLPPLVPTGPILRCLRNATSGGSTYDGGYDQLIQLVDGRDLHVYEKRGGKPVKAGGVTPARSGTRDVAGTAWTWSAFAQNWVMLETVMRDIYIELDIPGDETQIDTLADVARDLLPVEAFPRPSAREICAALRVGPSPLTVAAAFASSAGSVVKWHETPLSPDGPRPVSQWRDHPASEPVAVCYLDGDFGSAKGGPPGPGSVATPLPNWNRVVYLVGVDRRPIGVVFGWQDRIPIRDPGP
jgi:hypothetical protein